VQPSLNIGTFVSIPYSYVDAFCLTSTVLCVVEVCKMKRKGSTWFKGILPHNMAQLIENHAHNRAAKATREWCEVVGDQATKFGLKPAKCSLM